MKTREWVHAAVMAGVLLFLGSPAPVPPATPLLPQQQGGVLGSPVLGQPGRAAGLGKLAAHRNSAMETWENVTACGGH